MARILVIGGHGKVARLAEPMLVAAGHEVTAVIRNPDQIAETEATGARVVVADLEKIDQDVVDQLVVGFEVVVWTAGAGGGDADRTRAVDEVAALRVLAGVEKVGSRLILVSYFDASLEHGVPSTDPFFAYAEAKAHVNDAIRQSDTGWVILGPSALTLGPEGGVEISSAGAPVQAAQVSRATVARMIVEVVARPGLSAVTINFNDGATPPGEAIDALQPVG